MTATDQPDLLFFDTFSHDTSEELNLDLVQFPKSVFVREIRIIPLGARVEGDFPGGVRLGATNPTKFHIDFFVNDLSKPGASTFESLGSLDYCQNGQIHMECTATEAEPTRIPTDGLVLRGWYTTITLAVYGNLTVISEPVPAGVSPAPPAPKPALSPAAPVPVPSDWSEQPNPIPTYTSNPATASTEVYGPPNYPPENYDTYRGDYYENEAPKDPRTYHMEGPDWDKERRGLSCDREPSRLSPRSEHDRDRDRRDGRSRRRSLDRRSRESSRLRDRSRDRLERLHSRSRSRDRDYVVKGEYRPLSRSRSRSIDTRDRLRGVSSERDWDRSSYKKDDYRRHRDSSYERSRAGSYDKRSGSFDRRASPYDKRGTSYDRKRASPYDKRGSSYERRGPSYDRQPYDKKRHSPYSRIRSSSYNSRSPSRDDPRKRPRTPPSERKPISPSKASPNHSLRSDEGEYDRSGKQIPRVEFYQSYRHKTSIRSPSQEAESASFAEPPHSSLVTVPIVESTAPKTPESPIRPADDDKSMDAEQFEPILSDEDICDDLEGPAYMDVDYELNEYCGVDDIIKYYNPFKSEWLQYQNVNKVHLLASAKTENQKDVLTATFDELCDLSSDLFKISELTKLSKGREQKFMDNTFSELDNVSREEWVHQCEQIYVSMNNLCKSSDIVLRIFHGRTETDEFADIYNLLIAFCQIGLNFDCALAQQQPTYKIRHIKCGIRLAEALFSHRHNSQVMKTVLKAGLDIPMMLLQMYSKEYMALSIRLMILRALNACMSSKESIEHFMKPAVFPKFSKNDVEASKPKNGYQALISIMQTNPLARIKFSISAMIKKLNIYELLAKVQELVVKFNNEAATRDRPADNQSDDVELTDNEVDFIVDAIEQILHMFKSQCFHISQPKRFLPASAQFEINKECSNETLLEFFTIHHVMEACLYLLTCPTTCNNPVVVSPIHDLIYELIHSQNGLDYLYKNMEMSGLIFKTLMQPYGQQNSDEFLYPHDLTSYSDLQILGLELAYRLKSLYYLHSICDLQAGKLDENELIDRLQSLYCLSFGSIGKTAVPDVIVMADNAECLMEVFERDLKSRSKSESPSKQKSPAKGYAIELIVLAVRFSAHVPFLKKYGQRILNVAKDHDRFETSVSSVLQEVVPYLKPVDKSNLIAGDDLAECVEVVKTSAEHAPDVPGELTTCLRVLRHFCISDYDANVTVATESAADEYVELKYKYNVLQLFSLDGVAHLSGILERITAHFEQPSMHTAFFASMKGLQLAQMLVPCLRLLDEMLARVVRCRGSRFRDLTAAPLLLKIYGLVKTFPVGCVGYRTASRAAEAAVRALLAYSQPIADDAADGDSIRRGPWTSLCSEVISYTMTAPYTFVPGLLVFSELLPLPLPMQTKTLPTERELADAANERRLWSAHLHALSNDLIDMIQIICMSTYRPVVHMLRRVCVQIADLAPNTAATVARAAIGAVTKELKPSEPASASAQRVLGFLACLVAHAPVKCAVLHAVNSGGPKAADLPTALCSVLNLSHASSDHAAAQEFAAITLAGLCDIEVTLTPLTAQSDVLFANSLPNKESLASILDATATCLESPTKTSVVASSILRAYFVLTDHEFGFQQFVRLVGRKRESLGRFFRWAVEPGDDRADCLSLYLDLVRVLKAEEGEGPAGRRSTVGVAELADMVGYAGEEDHPALQLDTVLKERATEDDAVSNAQFLAALLQRAPASPGAPGSAGAPGVAEERPGPPPEPLARQFAGRWRRVPADPADERLTAAYWLTVPQDDPDTELVQCDIAEIAGAMLPGGWDAVAASVRRLAGAPDREPAVKHDPRPPVSLARVRAEGCADAFRSRPPNTSRPPSLHVDDFTALKHPAPPYGKPQQTRGMRRGGIAVADRGRFASSTPHYRHLRGRGAWEMGAQHFGHFPPAHYMMGGAGAGAGWGGARGGARGPRLRSFMR